MHYSYISYFFKHHHLASYTSNSIFIQHFLCMRDFKASAIVVSFVIFSFWHIITFFILKTTLSWKSQSHKSFNSCKPCFFPCCYASDHIVNLSVKSIVNENLNCLITPMAGSAVEDDFLTLVQKHEELQQ